MKILSMKFSPSSSQKPKKFALQPIKTCKTFEHFQLGSPTQRLPWDPWLPRCSKNLARSCQDSQDASKRANPGKQEDK